MRPESDQKTDNDYAELARRLAEVRRQLPKERAAQILFDDMVTRTARDLKAEDEQFDRDRFYTGVYHVGGR